MQRTLDLQGLMWCSTISLLPPRQWWMCLYSIYTPSYITTKKRGKIIWRDFQIAARSRSVNGRSAENIKRRESEDGCGGGGRKAERRVEAVSGNHRKLQWFIFIFQQKKLSRALQILAAARRFCFNCHLNAEGISPLTCLAPFTQQAFLYSQHVICCLFCLKISFL